MRKSHHENGVEKSQAQITGADHSVGTTTESCKGMRHPKFYRDAGRLQIDENVFDDFSNRVETCGCVNSSQAIIGATVLALQRFRPFTFTGCAANHMANVAQTLGSPAHVQATLLLLAHWQSLI